MAIIEVTDSGIATTNRNEILQQLITIFKGVYGENTFITEGTEDYNMLVSLADLFNDMGMVANSVSNGMNLQSATGFQLDNIATLFYNKVNRFPATYSTVDVTITGTPNTQIVAGQVKDVTGGIWDLKNSNDNSNLITIGADGTVTAKAIQTVAGAYYIEAGQINGFGSIVTPVAGWTNVTNPSESNIGEDVESDAKFRYRLAVAAQGTAKSVANALYTNLIGLENVSSVNIWENDTNSDKSFDDIALENVPAHNIVIAVFGDNLNEEDVATQIYTFKGTGVGTFAPSGVDSSKSVTIPNAFNQSQVIEFVQAQNANTYVNVTLLELTTMTITEELTKAIQEAIINSIDSVVIGGKIYSSELYIPIAQAITNSVGANTFNIQGVTIGLSANPTTTVQQYTYEQKPFTGELYITVEKGGA